MFKNSSKSWIGQLVATTISILFIFLIGPASLAATYSGTIRYMDSERSLELEVNRFQMRYKINAKSDIMNYIRRLKDGDQVIVQGTLNSDGREIKIESVDRVGLQELLGAWRSSRWEIFEFRDFNNLDLFLPTAGQTNEPSLVRTHSLKYVITPEQNSRYSIFLSDDTSVLMGFLEVQKNSLNLTITNSKTGQTSEKISLSPIRLQ